MNDSANKYVNILSRRNFIAQSAFGSAAILMNGIPVLAAGLTAEQSVATGNMTNTTPQHISLDGSWKFFYFPQEKLSVADPQHLKTAGLTAIDATVPGEAALELSRIGKLPADLYFGENITKLKPYELYEYWYQKEFDTPKETEGKRVELLFQGVDCLATYWLNGTKLGESENALIEHRFDVTGKLSYTEPNLLTIRLRSAVIEAAQKEYDPGITSVERTWIRKPAHSWGWNVMPRAVTAGLWRSVELVIHESNEIRDLYFATLAVNGNDAKLIIVYEFKSDLASLAELRLKVRGQCGDSTFTEIHQPTFNAGRIEISIPNAKLWWPRGYGDANLYKVTTQLLRGDEVLASHEDTIGIRTIELIRTDTTTVEKPGQFLFKVNGVPILVKGSNWVTGDAFHSRDKDRHAQMLALFVDLECNMLRSWGGGVYEEDEFFNICDRSGIMVWQDFAMACAIYPQTLDFQETIRQEATAVVRRLRNHPSLALWSGDNEVDDSYTWVNLEPSHNLLNRQILPQVVFQCDPYRPFLPSSPYISPAVIASGDLKQMPEQHLWDTRDYYKSKYYTEHTAQFLSEIGFDGCPGLAALKKFIDEKHLWPWKNNPQWILHSSNSDGNPFENHVMANETTEFFGSIPDTLEDFIVASQISQAEAYKFVVEMTRLKKWKRTGVIWWNMIDGWPNLNDSLVDYSFSKKLGYYYVRRVQQPICLMIDEPESWNVRVVMGNDSRQDASGHYRVWDADSGSTLLEGEYASKANENLDVGKIAVFHSDKKLFLMEWTVNGKRYVNHYLLGTPAFSLAQYRAWLPKIAALQNDFDAAKVGE